MGAFVALPCVCECVCVCVCVCVLGASACAWEFNPWQHAEGSLAERLRRRPAKPTGFPHVGPNPTGVDIFVIE
jgi:hypothetical protein